MLKTPFVWLVRAYQIALSPFLANRCRFYPTCSCYTLDALRGYPVPIALWLSLKRLIKCHPFCQGGLDPVPPQVKVFQRWTLKKSE